jgi:hypothetical protein
VFNAAKALGQCDAKLENPASVKLIKAVRPTAVTPRPLYQRVAIHQKLY